LTGSDTAHLLETRVLDPRTASRVLSVVYATDKSGENPKLQAIQPRASFTPGFSLLSATAQYHAGNGAASCSAAFIDQLCQMKNTLKGACRGDLTSSTVRFFFVK
jgi:hypothetical protein